MVNVEPARCATCGGDIDHYSGNMPKDPLPGKGFTTIVQNQALGNQNIAGGWMHMETKFDPEENRVVRRQHVDRDFMHPAVPHDGRTPELNQVIKTKMLRDTHQHFDALMGDTFPKGMSGEDEFTKPCVRCGTSVDSDVHQEEMGMCVGCSEKYWNHEFDEEDHSVPSAPSDMYTCRVCGKNSTSAEENMNHRCFE
jgi:hypothetical protein